MSSSLTVLVVVCAAMAAVAFVRPRRLLQYPVAIGLLMIAFILPQAYAIERLNLTRPFEPQYSWGYFTACMLMICVGFGLGARKDRMGSGHGARSTPVARLDSRRISIACAVMSSVGAFSYYQMSQLADMSGYNMRWTGVVTLYYLLSSLLIMSLTLSWLTFLRTGNRFLLVLAGLSLLIFLPTLTVSIKRSWIFEVAVVILGGLMLVRRYRPGRIPIAVGVIAGTLLMHQVGTLRTYIRDNDATIVQALRAGALTDELAIFSMDKAPEVQGGVTRIEISRREGEFQPGVDIWNRLVHQYFPAFLLGQDTKDLLKIDSSIEEDARAEFFWLGATATGFADTFSGFWWFGSLLFFGVAYFFGRLWSRAEVGELQAQFLYLTLLNDGLVAITESVARFIASLPFILIVTFLVFNFVRIGRVVVTQPPRPRSVGLSDDRKVVHSALKALHQGRDV